MRSASLDISSQADPGNQRAERRPPLVAIVGPTGVGKTALAIQLAQRLEAEIVSADSRLLYRGMDIGTAKPTLAERASVPHHLIDVAEPDQVWSLAQYLSAARRAIEDIHRRKRLPLLVGGTGQYLRSLSEGWRPPEVAPLPHLRLALENWARQITPAGLHQRLRVIDPTAAERIDPRNLRRTVRALEVIFSTGTRFSEQRSRSQPPYRMLQLGLTLPRPELYRRIDARIEQMIAAGLVEEVAALLEGGYAPKLPTFSAIGYREISAYLQGEISLGEAVRLMKRQTRIFVRRQANWFRLDDPNIHWFNADENPLERMETLIRRWLAMADF